MRRDSSVCPAGWLANAHAFPSDESEDSGGFGDIALGPAEAVQRLAASDHRFTYRKFLADVRVDTRENKTRRDSSQVPGCL